MSESRENIRPQTSPEEAKNLLYKFYGLEALEVCELECYVDRTFYMRVERPLDCGFGGSSQIGGREYILKIMNSIDSAKQHVDAEAEVQEFLFQRGISCPRTVRNLSDQLKSFITDQHQSNDVTRSRTHVVRLLTYLPGEVLGDVPRSTHLFISVGKVLADVQMVLKDFRHPGIDNYETLWNMESIPNLKTFFQYIPNEIKLKQAERVIQDFEEQVVPKYFKVERGTIHSDFNEKNIIVNKVQSHAAGRDQYEITGIIDFGDLQSTCLIFDLTNAMTYMILENKGACADPVEAGGYVLRGYLGRRNISNVELEMMPYCVMARYVQSLVLGAYSYSLDPGNEYLLTSAREGWEQLDLLLKLGAGKILEKWLKIAMAN